MDTLDQFIEKFVMAVDFQKPVPITGDTALASLPEWDSLATLGVIVMFDVDYNKNIVSDDITRCVTVGDLYKLAA